MGQALALAFAKKGMDVYLTWNTSESSAKRVQSEIESQTNQKVHLIQANLSLPIDRKRIVQEVDSSKTSLSTFVYLASQYERTPTDERVKHLEEAMAIHATAAYDLTSQLAPQLSKATPGRVVLFSDWTSASGRPRYQEYEGYYISKAAVKATVEALALKLAPHVIVNGIAPGPILPPPELSKEEVTSVARSTPLQRWGGVGSIVETVLFLSQTSYITGETIRVDGGRHLY